MTARRVRAARPNRTTDGTNLTPLLGQTVELTTIGGKTYAGVLSLDWRVAAGWSGMGHPDLVGRPHNVYRLDMKRGRVERFSNNVIASVERVSAR